MPLLESCCGDQLKWKEKHCVICKAQFKALLLSSPITYPGFMFSEPYDTAARDHLLTRTRTGSRKGDGRYQVKL